MQNNITLKRLSDLARRFSLFVFVALLTLTVNSQTLSTIGATNYSNNYAINNPSAALQTFVIENTNATARVLNSVSMVMAPYNNYSGASTIKLYYSATSLSGVPTVTSPVWTLIGTGTVTIPATPVAPATYNVLSGLTFVVPANTQYRFAIEATKGLAFSFSPTPTPNIFTTSGVSLKVGDFQIAAANIGYAGLSPTPNAANTPTFFGGSVTLTPFTNCSGTPAPGNTLSTLSSACPGTAFTLSLQNPTAGSDLVYDWQSASALAGPYTSLGGTSSTYTVASMSATTFYRAVVTCGANPGTSTPIQVNSIVCYCTSNATSTADEEIFNVSFGGMSNSSTCTTTAPGAGSILNQYSNYTGYTGAPTGTVLRGLSSPFSVQIGTCGGNYGNSVGVWIDYNQDGTFAASEKVYASAASTNGPHTETASILIPVTALAGTTRMRVVSVETAPASINACGTYTWGETEDYNINIVVPTPCTGTPAPGNTLSSASAVCAGTTGFNLSLQNNPPVSGLTYQWFSGPTATGTFTPITGATNPTYSVANIMAGTCYYATVTCSGNTASSTPVCVALNPIALCYCASNATTTADEEILNVTVGTLNNSSTCTTLAPGPGSIASGYSNYTSYGTAPAAPSITQGTNVPFSVQVGTCGTFAYTNSTAIWVDLNADGIFTANERVYVSAAGTPGAHLETGNLVIPVTATLGITRMRVITVENGTPTSITPCGTYGYGETEDYNVNITPCVPITLTSSPTNATVSCGNNTTFTVGVTGSAPVFQWQYRVSATAVWQNVTNVAPYSNATTATLTISNVPASLNGYQYRVLYSGGCSAIDFTAPATLTVTALVPVVTPATASICAGANTIVPISIGNFGSTLSSTFSSAANLALPISESGTGTTNILPVTLPGTAQILDIKVKLNIAHTWVGDLIIALKSPNGQVYNLSYALNGTDNGPGGFTNTVLSFNPTFPLLSTGANPFTSTYRVDGRIAATATPLDNGTNTAVRPTGPTGFTATTNVPATFFGGAGAGAGAWTIAMYDFYDDGANGGSINRLVNWSMDITYGNLASGIFSSTPSTPNTMFTNATATTPYDGVTPINTIYVTPNVSTVYTVAINTGTCSATTTVPVTVNTAAAGTLTVANVSACAGSDAVFSFAGLTAGTGLTYQWQNSTALAPATFTNIAGATASTYTVVAASASQAGNMYRIIVSSTGCTVSLTSTAGLLTVNPVPVVTITAAPIRKLFPGLTTTLTAATSPNPTGALYQWFRNGTAVAGATLNNKLVVGIDALGSYTVKVTDVNGCVNAANLSTPTSIEITDSSNLTRLFIYPSPNRGQFQVRYFNGIISSNIPTVVNVYDEKGSQVFTQTYSIGGGYQPMNVDLGALHAKGIYRVDLLTTAGERIKTGTVMVF